MADVVAAEAAIVMQLQLKRIRGHSSKPPCYNANYRHSEHSCSLLELPLPPLLTPLAYQPLLDPRKYQGLGKLVCLRSVIVQTMGINFCWL
jgi:hypothetical protein